MRNYVLDEQGEPKAVEDVLEWALWFDRSRKDRSCVVQQDRFLGDEIMVSTVFLGMDMSFGGGTPLLWETMVLGPSRGKLVRRDRTGKLVTYELDEMGQRHASKDDARTYHAVVVDRVEQILASGAIEHTELTPEPDPALSE